MTFKDVPEAPKSNNLPSDRNTEARPQRILEGGLLCIPFRGVSYNIADAGALAFREQSAGNFETALEIYRLMLGRASNSAIIHHNLGVTLQSLKRYEEALASFDRALALKPDFAEAYNSRGAVLQKLQFPAEALANYDRALALKFGYVHAYYNRGTALKSLRRYADALDSFDQALAFNPGHVDTHISRGVVLREMRRYDDALACFDRALALKPESAEACNNRSLVLANKGVMAAAEGMFRKAFTLNPEFSEPLFNLANIRHYDNPHHADVKLIRGFLDRRGISPNDEECLSFALGKIYDDCGLYDEAFARYRVGNRIRNQSVSYQSARETELTSRIIGAFDRDSLAGPWGEASGSAAPVFVVGMPRSGTTLLANILTNHPSVALAGEMPAILDVREILAAQDKSGGANPLIPPEIAARLVVDYEKRLRRDVPANIPFVLDKNPLNFRNLGVIAQLFPKARIIHCTRHPLDTCLSNYFQRFSLDLDYSFELANIGHYYGEYERLMQHWRAVLPLKLAEVSYEDMVLNTESLVRRMLEFLGLEWNERCLAPHTNPNPVESASHWQARQPIYQDSLGRWRHYEKHLGSLIKTLRAAGLIT